MEESDYPAIYKPTGAIHIGNDLKASERKLLNGLLYWAQLHNPRGKKGQEFKVSRTMAFTLLGENSNNIQILREGVETLTTTKINWDTFKRDSNEKEWKVCTFLAGGQYRNGTLSFIVNPYLEDLLYHPSIFAKIQLCVQAKFQGKYTIALYEYLVDELHRSGRNSVKVEVSIDELRMLLSYDGLYKHLNKDVLKPALKDINDKTDIIVNYSGKKEGRSITAIEFEIERKENFQLEIPLELETYIEETKHARISELRSSVESLGIDGAHMEEWLVDHSLESIDMVVRAVVMKHKSNELDQDPLSAITSLLADDAFSI